MTMEISNDNHFLYDANKKHLKLTTTTTTTTTPTGTIDDQNQIARHFDDNQIFRYRFEPEKIP